MHHLPEYSLNESSLLSVYIIVFFSFLSVIEFTFGFVFKFDRGKHTIPFGGSENAHWTARHRSRMYAETKRVF